MAFYKQERKENCSSYVDKGSIHFILNDTSNCNVPHNEENTNCNVSFFGAFTLSYYVLQKGRHTIYNVIKQDQEKKKVSYYLFPL